MPNKIKLAGLALIAVLFSTAAFAQDKCVSLEKPLKQKVFDLLADIKAGKKKPKDVDDFLGMLPDEMKKDFIFMTQSRSFQASSAKEPRVLMKSPNSEMIASFNSDPKDRGYERVELMFFNEKDAKFEFFDVEFRNGKVGKGAMPSGGVHDTIVTKNPEKCLKCHHSPARPNWDPYNFWAGQTPFNRDTVYPKSAEGKLYLQLLGRIEKGEPRYRQLKPSLTTKDFTDSQRQLRTDNPGLGENPDGPGVRIFDQLSVHNFCRIGNQLKDHPKANLFKYAAAGIFRRCPLSKMLPDDMKERAVKYFAGRGIKATSFEDLEKKILADTENRQNKTFADKVARQTAFFKDLTGSDAGAKEEMGKRRLENREDSLPTVAPLRTLLEPFDVDMKNWSMSIDPDTYTFADLLDGLNQQGLFKETNELLRGKNCDQIAEESKKAMAKPGIINAKACPECVKNPEVLAEAKKLCETKELSELENKGQAEFRIKCAYCHKTDSHKLGAPRIPFEDKQAFRNFLQENTDANVGWSEIIWGRVSREGHAPGHMPPIGGKLSSRELRDMRAYLDKLSPNGCGAALEAYQNRTKSGGTVK